MRLIDDQNNQLGVLSLDAALRIASEKGLDLVEVAPQAQPPVCRLMDYGRFKFETIKKEKDQRRKQNVIKVTIMFRGREMVHQDIGRRILDRVADDAKQFAIVERAPLLEGKNLFMILSPSRQPAAPAVTAAPVATETAPKEIAAKAAAPKATATKETATSA